MADPSTWSRVATPVQARDETASRGITGLLQEAKEAVVGDFTNLVTMVKGFRLNLASIIAIICVALVIVGNVMLLIAINFWLAVFPTPGEGQEVAGSSTTSGESAAPEEGVMSSQLAVQVASTALLVLLFSLYAMAYVACFGVRPLWNALVSTNRLRNRWYRFFLLFASGATNGITGILAVYAMPYTPEFIQAVLLCTIPFFAQIWTVLFIPEERKRRYLSPILFFSFVFFVAGVILSSISAFLDRGDDFTAASWEWALIYLASAVVFGLWCVVQRLYLDAVRPLPASGPAAAAEDQRRGAKDVATSCSGGAVDAQVSAPYPEAMEAALGDTVNAAVVNLSLHSAPEKGEVAQVDVERTQTLWEKLGIDDTAAKVLILVIGLIFQTLVSFALLPVDAIPWFGRSSTVQEAWRGFCAAMDFAFASWHNIRFGLLYVLGMAMSFTGCTYLNEHSPTLASVVLQLAGPLTGVTLIIIPSWDVYGSDWNVGQQVGGLILLVIAALLYHWWEQRSSQELLEKAERRLQQGEVEVKRDR